MTTAGHNRVVAIVGGSGAGKTWLVRRLCELLGDDACHLALDDFYRDRSHLPIARRARLNFDVPHAIDWSDAARVLRDCRSGGPTRIPRYNFATYSRTGAESWTPRPLIFVDGLWLLRSAEVRSLFDLRIFLDAPTPLRRERRLARDTAERGYPASVVRERLEATVLPMHERHVEPQRRWADLVLSQPLDETGASFLADALWPLLPEGRAAAFGTCNAFGSELLPLLLQHAYCD